VVGKDRLAKFNAGKHPVNEAWGLHVGGKTLSPIVGRSVDHEQVHHENIALLSGSAADWIRAGERCFTLKRDPLSIAEDAKHADGSDDISRCWCLLSDADPLDTRDVARLMPSNVREDAAAAGEYSRRAVESYVDQCRERFEALWQESLAFVAAKWPHVQNVGDAAARKLTLEADEITERIECIEERLQSYPSYLAQFLAQSRPVSAPGAL
jgi:hypothetical protein